MESGGTAKLSIPDEEIFKGDQEVSGPLNFSNFSEN